MVIGNKISPGFNLSTRGSQPCAYRPGVVTIASNSTTRWQSAGITSPVRGVFVMRGQLKVGAEKAGTS